MLTPGVINVGPTLIDLIGGCAFAPGAYSNFALNPNDPALLAALTPSGINLFADGDPAAVAGAANANIDWDGNGSPDDGTYNGNMIPITPSPGLVNQTISFQAFTVDATTSEAEGSQVFRTTLRANT